MLGNYRGIRAHRKIGVAALLFAALLASAAVRAETLHAGALALHYGSPWQRAGAEEEAAEQGAILTLREAERRLEVYLGQWPVVVTVDPQRFYERLEQAWARRHGEAGRSSRIEEAGTEWRLCRRPSRDGLATVFELVTLRSGHAHHVLVSAVGKVDSLPESVRGLLQSVVWDDDSANEAATGGLAGQSAPGPVPLVERRWRLVRVFRVCPEGEVLASLGAEEGRRLGAGGLLTGYALKLLDSGVDWQLEGFSWVREATGEEVKQPLQRHWQARWDKPPAFWSEGEVLPLNVELARADPLRSGGEFGLRFELATLCGEDEALQQTFDAIAAGAGEIDASLQSLARACLEGGSGTSPVELRVTGAGADTPGAGKVAKRVELALPLAGGASPDPQAVQPQPAIVLSVRFFASTAGDEPGDALLAPARVLFLYVAED